MWRVGGLVATAAVATAGEEEVVCVLYRMTQQLLSPVFSLFLGPGNTHTNTHMHTHTHYHAAGITLDVTFLWAIKMKDGLLLAGRTTPGL